MLTKNIYWFREVKQGDLQKVGGKGLNLGIMASANFPIPPGFVISAESYFDFLKENNIKEEITQGIELVDVENSEELQKASLEARELILKGTMDNRLRQEIKKAYLCLGERRLSTVISTSEEEFVAVRSSATAEDLPKASFAGAQASFLNVKGFEQVIEAVKKCWASLFTARAVYYRKKQGFPTSRVGIAVIIQKMVDSSVSGVMFTAEPLTGNEGRIVIEAGFGLGEAVVGGLITPDYYVVEKGSFRILEKKVNKQAWKFAGGIQGNVKEEVPAKTQATQKLSDNLITELAKIGRQVEQNFEKPQDIEWALEDKKLMIVQSRAITTLTKTVTEKTLQAVREPVLKGIAASPGIATGTVRVLPSIEEIAKVREGDIIATTMTSPDWVPAMQKAIAIVTDEGGVTSHAAIVSRELGIPCIVGTEEATRKLIDGEVVTVDGFKGVVFKGRVEIEKTRIEAIEEKQEAVSAVEELKETVKEAKEIEKEQEEKIEESQGMEKAMEFREKFEELLQVARTKVKVNVALPEAAERAAETGAEGVGLLRAEHLITAFNTHPAKMIKEGRIEELKEAVKKGVRIVAEKFKEKPVWYRTFDARTDEFRNLEGGSEEPVEENPMLGWHGIRRDLDEPEMLKAQFRALKELREEGFENIAVMLPFVQSIEELRKAKEIASECGLKAREDVKFGVMIETPASVWIIEDLIEEGIDFVSFGTNDLTQLTLGVDRNNEKIQKLFNELHPAVLNQIGFVIFKCKKFGIETSICGQAASNPEMACKLVRMGISSISANIDAVEKIRKTVAEEEKTILLEVFEKLEREKKMNEFKNWKEL